MYAKKMLTKGADYTFIEEITGLSKEELDELERRIRQLEIEREAIKRSPGHAGSNQVTASGGSVNEAEAGCPWRGVAVASTESVGEPAKVL